LIVARVVSDELQFTEAVSSWVLPSLKVAVAVNCCVAPTEIDGLVGETLIDTGTRIWNSRPADVPPPGGGLVTEMDREATPVISAGVTITASWVELMKVVVLALPLMFTTELEMKPVPVTVRVKAGAPTSAAAGESPVGLGTGLLFTDEDPPPQPVKSRMNTRARTHGVHCFLRSIEVFSFLRAIARACGTEPIPGDHFLALDSCWILALRNPSDLRVTVRFVDLAFATT
jgi:hypothetical protein